MSTFSKACKLWGKKLACTGEHKAMPGTAWLQVGVPMPDSFWVRCRKEISPKPEDWGLNVELTSLQRKIKLSREPGNGEAMTQKRDEAPKKEGEKMRFCFFANRQLDQLSHTRETKISMVCNRDNKNQKNVQNFSVGHLLQCCPTKLAWLFLQISVSGTGTTPLATGNTASNPESYSHSTTCTFAPRSQNKARHTVSRRPTVQSPPAQCASVNW
jgi:hypothetical protein